MRVNIINILILLIISSFLIFYKFNAIPKNISFDEIEFAQLALSLDNKSYISYSPLAFGHSTVYFYIILASFKIFGVSNFALRLPSALFGIAGILMFYFVMGELLRKIRLPNSNFKIPVSSFQFLASFALVSSRWYLNFARFSFEATFLLFLELTAIYFLLKKSVNWSAVFSGLSFLSYTPGRLFFIFPLIFLIIEKRWKEIAKYLIIFAVTTSSLVIYLFQNPDYRIREVAVKNMNQVIETGKRTALMFHFQGDMNGRHNFPGKPALNPILGLFFAVGIITAIKNLSKFENKLMLGYFAISLLPTLLTIPQDNPNMLRTFTTLPSIVYFATLPFLYLFKTKFKFRTWVLFVSCFLYLVSSAYELRTYFVFQSRVARNSFEVKCPLQKVVKYNVHKVPKSCRVQKNEF